ncbi:TPA: erythromycin resistance leader peptide, partial [Staphylococcus aureus]|nr:erythromycin resistance leader peptide [Staphylococcus aureus]
MGTFSIFVINKVRYQQSSPDSCVKCYT